jgi:hypothetical protein
MPCRAAKTRSAAGQDVPALLTGSRTSPRQRFVKLRTKRFRGDAADTPASALTIQVGALSAAEARIPAHRDDV